MVRGLRAFLPRTPGAAVDVRGDSAPDAREWIGGGAASTGGDATARGRRRGGGGFSSQPSATTRWKRHCAGTADRRVSTQCVFTPTPQSIPVVVYVQKIPPPFFLSSNSLFFHYFTSQRRRVTDYDGKSSGFCLAYGYWIWLIFLFYWKLKMGKNERMSFL